MTIRGLFREFAVHRMRSKDETVRDIAQAWHVVRIWAKTKSAKRLDGLTAFLPKTVTSEHASPSMAYQRSVLEVLSAQYNIPLRKAGRYVFPKAKKRAT